MRSDFAALYRGLESAHADLFARRSRDQYDALYQEMMSALTGPMSLFDATVMFQRFVAFGDIAHARIAFPAEEYDAYRQQGGRAFPLYLRIVDGRCWVAEDLSGSNEVEPGDELLALNGEPISTWLDRTAANLSADTDYMAAAMLEYQFPALLWLELGEREAFDLKLKTADGEVRQVTVSATTREQQAKYAGQQPGRFELDPTAREARMLDEGIAYLRPGPFYNIENPASLWDASDFMAFIDDAFNSFLDADANVLVLDLRENPGGDNSFSDPIIAWFADRPFRFYSEFLVRSSDEAAASNQARIDGDPDAIRGVSGRYAELFEEHPRGEVFAVDFPSAQPRSGRRFEGEVIALVNRRSYSNAVTTAAIIQDYGFGQVAGEETSDLATTYGAVETFTLPETGIRVDFPKALIIRPAGSDASETVVPDIPIATPVLPQPEDVVLRQLLSVLRGEAGSASGG